MSPPNDRQPNKRSGAKPGGKPGGKSASKPGGKPTSRKPGKPQHKAKRPPNEPIEQIDPAEAEAKSKEERTRIRRAVKSALHSKGGPPPAPPLGNQPHQPAQHQSHPSYAKSPRPGKRPPLRPMTTTLWEYPSQHYDAADGSTVQGNKHYTGATPSWVIWQLLTRYTREGDVVLDPMVGGGTTIDVCHDLKRTPECFDLAPSRDDIRQADARNIPVADASIDFAFVDPPYSTHIDYSDDPDCIGKLDASTPSKDGRLGAEYYDAMENVIAEMHRALKNRRYAALYVSDSWRKRAKGDPGRGTGVFMPIGFELFNIMLRTGFSPVDIIAVVRGNAKLKKGNWHKSADESNFFLRGFNYLFIVQKDG